MNKFIVAYSYSDKFEISEAVAVALISAKEKRLPGVKTDNQFFSTSFLWILPKEQTDFRELSPEQMVEAGKIAEWLLMPVHGLGWSEKAAIEYAKKLVLRADRKELKELNRRCGYFGDYPNPKKFLMGAKQLENVAETPPLTE